MHSMEEAKEYWKSHHMQSARLLPRGEGQDHRYELAEEVLKFSPNTVLEFGCNSGRNLAAIYKIEAAIKNEGIPSLTGVDMCEQAVKMAIPKHPYINYIISDEKWLENQKEQYDVVFTCSVLDHIPDWKPVYDHLKRLARKALIIYEPILEKNGIVLEGDAEELGVKAAAYTYSWDYEKYDPDLKRVRSLPIPDLQGTLGPLYHIFVLDKENLRGKESGSKAETVQRKRGYAGRK